MYMKPKQDPPWQLQQLLCSAYLQERCKVTLLYRVQLLESRMG